MTAYRMTIAELKDLSEVTVICRDCSMRLTLPVETGLMPERCPSCNKVFDQHLAASFTALGRFVREGKATESRIEFAIKDNL